MDSSAQINQTTSGIEDASFYYPLAHISSADRKTSIALTSNYYLHLEPLKSSKRMKILWSLTSPTLKMSGFYAPKIKKKLQEAIVACSEKAAKAEYPTEAMQYTQAAVNAANALICLESFYQSPQQGLGKGR